MGIRITVGLTLLTLFLLFLTSVQTEIYSSPETAEELKIGCKLFWEPTAVHHTCDNFEKMECLNLSEMNEKKTWPVISVIREMSVVQILHVLGPLGLILIIACLLKWRIFGPVTHETLLLGLFPFSSDIWKVSACCLLLAALVTRPFYTVLSSVFHRYYRLSLRKAFFAEGCANA